MSKKHIKKKTYVVILAVLVLTILLMMGYKWRKSYQIDRANSVFAPKEKTISGAYIPWPLGKPSILGRFDNKTATRIRKSFNCEYGSIKKGNMELIIHASDNTFFVHFK